EMDNIMQIAMIDKKEFFDKFKSNDKIRFLFGYKNKEKYDSDDYFEMTLRVWVDEKYFNFNEIYNNSKAKDDLDAMILFEKTSFFKELRKQTIKIDFLSQNFIVPDFFKEHNIKIIPYFQLCNDEDLTTKQFFKFLKEMKVDKLNYITYILGDDLIEDEYRHIHK
ncbi:MULTISPECIES: hypothetical protein, partial [unclassified Campylobacter]|uniref:hypothetical protein n=1 Tax=unclassified Campylobacter TaxID=2593542 RepID=UPI001C8E47C1